MTKRMARRGSTRVRRAPMRSRGTRGLSARGVATRVARGLRKRGPGSMTQPKRRKLNQKVHETRGGSESSLSIGSKSKGLRGKIARMSQDIVYQGNYNQIYSIGAGSQLVKDVWDMGDAPDYQVLMTQALTQEFGSATPIGYHTAKIYIKSIHAEYAYNNNTNDQVRFQIYDIQPRKDVYQVGTGQNNPGSPVNAWQVGMSYESPTSGGTSTAIVGSAPFMSRLFTTNYKVLKITNVTLAPGQTHYHNVSFSPNKFLDNDLLSSGAIVSFKGLTINNMVVAYGAPCADSTGGVTTEAVKLLMLLKYRYTYTYVPNNMTTLAPSNNILSTATSGNIENMVTGASSVFAAV